MQTGGQNWSVSFNISLLGYNRHWSVPDPPTLNAIGEALPGGMTLTGAECNN